MGNRVRVTPSVSRFDERLLLAYVALAPVLVIHVSGQPFGAVDLLAPLGVVALLRGPHTLRVQVVLFWIFFIALLAGTVYLLMSGQANVTDLDALRVIRVMFIFVPFLIVLQMPNFSREFMLRLMRVFLWSGSIACVIAIALFYLDVQIRDSQQMNWSGGDDASLRAGGLLGNSADVGHVAAMLGIVALGYRVLNPAYGRAYIIPLAIALHTTYVSSSRAAILQLVVASIVLMPLLFQNRRILPFFGLPVAAGLLIIKWDDIKGALGNDFMARRFDILNITGDSTFFSVNSRLNSWDRSWDLFGNNPIFGVGYNGIHRLTGRSGDNSFISVLTEGGLIAGSAYALLWVSILWAILRSPQIRIRLVGLAMVSAEIAQMLTVDTHRQPTTTAVVLALIACLVRVAAIEAKATPRTDESVHEHADLHLWPSSGARPSLQ